MRGSIVVLALAVSPFVASVSHAQSKSHVVRREMPASSRSADKKCAERQRGNPSETGLENRADPRTKGNKDCATSAPPTEQPPATGSTLIAGVLFDDKNGDGYQGADEPGLAGWTVTLSGPSRQSLTTDASGAYTFPSLSAGMYTVCVVPQSGWAQTAPSDGASCSSGFGFLLEAPALVGDVWYSGVDFGFKAQ